MDEYMVRWWTIKNPSKSKQRRFGSFEVATIFWFDKLNETKVERADLIADKTGTYEEGTKIVYVDEQELSLHGLDN